MATRIVIGKRRFTCLSTGLVRMEFSPTGKFEDRRSLAAYERQRPVPFRSVRRSGGEIHLDTGRMTVVSRDHTKSFFPSNLEVRWNRSGLLQFWRAGDPDHQNLGGTIRSLDGFNRYAPLDGVHAADLASPDYHGLAWVGWNLWEVDPWYYQQCGKENVLLGFRDGHGMHHTVRYEPEKMLVRTANHARDAYRYPPGLLSRSGYFLLNDSDGAVMDDDDFPVERKTPGTQDWYFFCYNDDYKSALADLVLLSGRAPIPSKDLFGLIFSRWPAYDEAEARKIVQRFRSERMPLSVLVVDMEWHKEGWCHWDWDAKMYPEPESFFDWCHRTGLLVTLNVHPLRMRADDSHFKAFIREAGTAAKISPYVYNNKKHLKVDVDICRKREAVPFMRLCHDPIVRQGMDFWWLDGSRGTLDGACDQLVANKLYFENVETPERRGNLLSRYAGIGSHRYGVFFTGDTHSEWEVLERLCEFNIRAGHVGMGYVSHDTGGFGYPAAPLIDPIRYVRWLQFGVFNPVLRFHSSPGSGSRQPWDYGPVNLDIARRWLRLRSSLVPYIYSAARCHHETGVPLVRGLFLEHPGDEASYRFDEFYFGDSLLVAPILTPDAHREVYLPAGGWFEFLSGRPVAGGRTFGVTAGLGEIPVYARAGSVILRQDEDAPPAAAHVEALRLDVFPCADGAATLYEDDGRSPRYKKGAFCKTRFTLKDDGERIALCSERPQGRPLGKTRTITVDVVLAKRPRGIALDGRALPDSACTRLDGTGRFRIVLPARPAAKPLRLTIRR